MSGLLVIENLVSGYGKKQVVAGVSLRLEAGQIVAIIGPNGAGKSTVLRTITGYVPPWAGSIRVRDRDTTGLPPHRLAALGVGFCPQGQAIFPEMTIEEHLLLGGWLLKRRGEVRRRRDEVYELFPRLRERAGQAASTLSGGERQMLSVGRALMPKPEVLLLDEPSIGLAPRVVDEVFDLLDAIRAQGIAILLVEQNAAKALTHADWAYVLEMGRNRLEGPGADLLADERVRQLYLGG